MSRWVIATVLLVSPLLAAGTVLGAAAGTRMKKAVPSQASTTSSGTRGTQTYVAPGSGVGSGGFLMQGAVQSITGGRAVPLTVQPNSGAKRRYDPPGSGVSGSGSSFFANPPPTNYGQQPAGVWQPGYSQYPAGGGLPISGQSSAYNPISGSGANPWPGNTLSAPGTNQSPATFEYPEAGPTESSGTQYGTTNSPRGDHLSSMSALGFKRIFHDGFENMSNSPWRFESGWEVYRFPQGGAALKGVGHAWARLPGQQWNDFALAFRLYLVRGGINASLRGDPQSARRYFVSLGPEQMELRKQSEQEIEPQSLAKGGGGSLGKWHLVGIVVRGGRLSARVDGNRVEYEDPEPLAAGQIAFETTEDSEAYIDDVTVFANLATPKAIEAGLPSPDATVRSIPPPPATAVDASLATPVVQVASVSPLPNELPLRARPITSGEIQAGDAFFRQRLQTLTQDFKKGLGLSATDPQQVLAELAAKSVGADAQVRILDAVKAGDGPRVKGLWAAEVKDATRAEELARRIALHKAVGDLETRSAAGTLSEQDIAATRLGFEDPKLDASGRQSALKILAELEQLWKISRAVTTASPGAANDRATIPGGRVPVIRSPKMAVGRVLVLGNGYVMVGTGGRGDFELSTDTVAHALGLPIESTEPLGPTSEEPITQGILLSNPATTKTTAQYSIAGREYHLEPGSVHAVSGDTARTIDFLRGRDLGRKQYTIEPGTYAFTGTDQGWEVYRQSYKVLLDNTANATPFHCTVQNQRVVVGASGTAEQASMYPIVIRFDRGNGAGVKRCRVEGDQVKVAINAADNLWDLFPASGSAKPPVFEPAF